MHDSFDGTPCSYGCVLRGDLACITLETRVNLQDGCIVHTDSDSPMTIEEGVVVGHGAILHGARIGRDSLVGMGAMLLSGCELGEQCLVAAGTVITEGRRIPPRCPRDTDARLRAGARPR